MEVKARARVGCNLARRLWFPGRARALRDG